MVATARALDYFLNEDTGKLRNDSSGEITPEVLRDLGETLFSGYGGLYKDNGSETQEVDGTEVYGFLDTPLDCSTDVTANTTDKRIEVSVDGVYLVLASLAFYTGATTSVSCSICKNASPITVPLQASLKGVGNQTIAHMFLAGIAELTGGDYVDVRVTEEFGGGPVTITNRGCSLVVLRIG